MKKIILVLGCLIVFVLGASEVHADERMTVTDDTTVLYDFEQGGVQQFDVVDEEGEALIITVEEEPPLFRAASNRISTSAVNNGTYRVTKERALQWKVSYKIDVRGDAITRAHSPSITNYIGSVTRSSLKVDHAKQATYYINMKFLTFNSTVNVRAKLQTNGIVITY